MDWYKGYKLTKDGEEYILKIYLDKESEEFSKEFFSNVKENVLTYNQNIKKLLDEKFSDVKIGTIKLLVGSMVVATIPFAAVATVQAEEPSTLVSQASASTGTVNATKLNVRSGPSSAYSVIHVLWNGNKVSIVDESDGWYKIQLSDGRTGWVSKAYLTASGSQTMNITGTVTANKLNMRSGPSTDSSILHVLWNGNTVRVIGSSGNWYKIELSDGRTGWVSKDYLRLNSAGQSQQQQRDTVVATAKSFLGTPYVWGGASPADGGFDCSGFSQYIYRSVGYDLNRISADQARQGTPISYTEAQPGDLLFYGFNQDGVINHLGIYLGNGKMIHSPKTGDVVKITDITTSYWQTRYVTARQIIA